MKSPMSLVYAGLMTYPITCGRNCCLLTMQFTMELLLWRLFKLQAPKVPCPRLEHFLLLTGVKAFHAIMRVP